MFTGLVDDIGTIDRVAHSAAGREFRVRTRYDSLAIGESVALNGACLTVLAHGDGWFTVAAVVTTLGRTAMDRWHDGTRVNLERAMRLGDRLGGHLVQGHVDGVGIVSRTEDRSDALLIDVVVPRELAPLIVVHGSVAVDGVSLTVNALPLPDVVQLSIIEHTRRHTTLGALVPGDRVQLEADVIGKFVQRLVAPYIGAGATA